MTITTTIINNSKTTTTMTITMTTMTITLTITLTITITTTTITTTITMTIQMPISIHEHKATKQIDCMAVGMLRFRSVLASLAFLRLIDIFKQRSTKPKTKH